MFQLQFQTNVAEATSNAETVNAFQSPNGVTEFLIVAIGRMKITDSAGVFLPLNFAKSFTYELYL